MAIPKYISQLQEYLNGTTTNADYISAEFDQILRWLNQHEDLFRGKITGDNINDLSISNEKLAEGIDGLKIQLDSIGKDRLNFPLIDPDNPEFINEPIIKKAGAKLFLDVGRTGKSHIGWNANSTADYGMDFNVDGTVVGNITSKGVFSAFTKDKGNSWQKLGLETMISVKEYGATGNGIVDDTAAIQKAIDNVPSGSVLFFPSGTYLISRLNINRFVHFKGAGRSTMFKRINNDTTTTMLDFDTGDTLHNLEISDFRIIGSKATNTVNSYGLRLSKGHNAIIRNVFINDTKGSGFVIVSTSNSHLIDCWTHGCDGNSIYLAPDSPDCHIFGGDFGSSLHDNIYIGSPSSSARDLIAWGARSGANIRVASSAPSVQIIGCTAEGSIAGHNISIDANHVLVTGCKIYDAGDSVDANKLYSGVHFVSTTRGRGSAILNNIFYGHLYNTTTGNHLHHINLNNVDYVSVLGNSMIYNGAGETNGVPDPTFIPVNGMTSTTKTDYSWTQSYVQGHVATETTLPAATWTDLTFTESKDTEGEFNGVTFTPKHRGTYQVEVSLMLKGTTSGMKMLRVLHNSSERRLNVVQSPVTGWVSISGSITLDLVPGNTIKIQAYSAAADQTFSTGTYTNMSIKLLK